MPKFIVSYLGITGFSIAAAILSRDFLPPDMRGAVSSTWEVFYAVFGVIYAIVIGFILAELLTRFQRLMSGIGSELNALQSVRDFLIYVDDNKDAKHAIILSLRNYISSVLNSEWHRMDQKTDLAKADTSDELYALMQAVGQIKIANEGDSLALSKLIEKISDVTVYRTERFDHSCSKLSPLLHALIVFMSTIMVVGIILIPVESIILQMFMVISMTTAVYILYCVVIDLNKPFVGVWNISSVPLRQMLDTLDLDKYGNPKDRMRTEQG